jgi:hypothetical protein
MQVQPAVLCDRAEVGGGAAPSGVVAAAEMTNSAVTRRRGLCRWLGAGGGGGAPSAQLDDANHAAEWHPGARVGIDVLQVGR